MSHHLRQGPSGPEFSANFQRLLGNDTDLNGALEDVSISQALDWIPGTSLTNWIFDGINDFVQIGTGKYAFERTQSWSTSFWFQTNSSSTGVIIGNVQADASNRGWSIYIFSGGGLHFKLTSNLNTNDIDVSTVNSFNDGQLHHCAITYDGTSLASGVQIWIDKIPQALGTVLNSLTLTTVSTGALRIGIYGSAGTFPYNGILQQISIFPSLVLTQAQVDTLADAGIPPNVLASGIPNLGSYWKFNDEDTDAPNGITDYGPNHFDGTAQGGLTLSPRGDLILRGSNEWERLSAGNQNAPLLSGGFGQKPYWPEIGSLIRTGFNLFVTVSPVVGAGVRDLAVFDQNAPFDFRILDATMYTTTPIGGSTVTARSLAGGLGTAYTSALSTAASGTARNASTTGTSTVATGGSLFLRFTDGRVGGQFTAPIALV